MDLILWRHAEAEDGIPDLARRLTAKGARQAERMADWLRPRLPASARILCSPAKRALQTAAALDDRVEVLEHLAPSADYSVLLEATGWPDAGRPIVVVGHQPTLGRTAAFLLAGEPADWSVRKGGVWWLSLRRREEGRIVLRAVLSPELL